MVDAYYDLVTDFYERGWGPCFHFAPRRPGESRDAATLRHESYLALRIGLAPTDRAVDVGCGIGGPMRNIARLSGAQVVGINNNAYQIARGLALNRTEGLADRCSFVKADFADTGLDARSFDAAYSIEALCHAGDRAATLSEVRRILRPDALLAGYDWCLTDRYDEQNREHRRIRKSIERGDALPELRSTGAVNEDLKRAGFDVLDSFDAAAEPGAEPWYQPLLGTGLDAARLGRSAAGRWVMQAALRTMERIGVAARGTATVHELLLEAADGLIAGGRSGVFTPMYFFLARNPG